MFDGLNTLDARYVSFTNGTYIGWMMLYPFIVLSILLQYCRNNRIASCYNYCSEYFQYQPTLIMIQYIHIYIYIYIYCIKQLNCGDT